MIGNVGSLHAILNEALLIHDVSRNHWVMSSSIDQEVTVYDSRFSGGDFHLISFGRGIPNVFHSDSSFLT